MFLIALAVLAATPTSLNSVIAAARPGDTVRLVAGSYPYVLIKKRSSSPSLTIDAGSASVVGVGIARSSGVNWTRGVIAGLVAPGTDATG